MQMINVLKRLAELDAQNPNMVKEDIGVAECGPMGMMDKPKTPATINITADSGEELGDMLGAIMKLAGVKQVGSDDIGVETDPSTLVTTPITAVGSHSAGDEMRSVIDKMHNAGGDDSDEEETDEGSYDNSPTDPNKKPSFNSNQFANQENSPNVGNRMDGNMPKGNATFESLMSEYQEFIAEGKECKVCEKPVKKCTCD